MLFNNAGKKEFFKKDNLRNPYLLVKIIFLLILIFLLLYKVQWVEVAISLIDSTISLPIKIDNFEKLCNSLKEDVTFTAKGC